MKKVHDIFVDNQNNQSNSQTASGQTINPSNVNTSNQYQTQVSQHTPVWLMLLLIIVFQPAAWYLIYKENRYHAWFAFLIWLFAIPFIVVYALMGIFVIPQLSTLYTQVNAEHPSMLFVYAMLGIFIAIGLAEVSIGIKILQQRRKPTGASKKLLKVALSILVLNFVLGFASTLFTVSSVISPIYSLTNAIGK